MVFEIPEWVGSAMKYTKIPFVEKPVSRVVLGGSGSLFTSGGDISDVMEAALESGINCVDTARAYGKSEEAIGRYFRQTGRRKDFVLISKCCHPALSFLSRVDSRSAAEDLERSLEALETEHIDIYFLHRDNEGVSVGKIAEFMHRFHEEGKIGAFGGSNWSADRIAALNAYAESHGLTGFTVSSPHYSLGRQRRDPWGNGCKTVTGDKNAPQREFYTQTKMPLFCWASLCGGMFSGKLKSAESGGVMKHFGFNAAWGYGSKDNYERLRRCELLASEKGITVAQTVLAWILGSKMNTLAIAGGSSGKRVTENSQATAIELTEAERCYLDLRDQP